MKKLISLVLCVVMLASLACLGVSAAPEGTAIKNAEEFAAMKADGSYYLDADFAVSKTYMDEFTGTLDGNGHTITISAPLFAEFNGTVSNLTLDGAELTGTEDLAAFTLFSKYMKAYNVTNKVDITVTGATLDETGAVKSGTNAGGLVADTWKDTDNMITLRNCKNYGKITVSTDHADAAGTVTETHAGGFVGYAEGLNAKFCENYGDVTASCSQGQAGGIVGRAARSALVTTFNVEYCTVQANVTGGLDAGGIVGYVGASNNNIYEPYTVYYCAVIGDVKANYRGGGFIGYAYCSGANLTYYTEIINSIFVGNVYGGRAATNEKGSAQYAYTSMFLGYGNSVNNSVQNCLAWGEIKTLEGEGFDTNQMKVFMGCSSAKTPDMIIENVYICDNNTTEWYSYASAEKNAAQQIKIEDVLGTKITRCTEDEIKNGAILNKLNTNAGEEVFVQKAGTDLYPSLNPTFLAKAQEQDAAATVDTTTEEPKTTTTAKKDDTTTTPKDTTTPAPKDTTTAAPTVDTTTAAPATEKSGCGSVVALSLMALVIPAAVVVAKKKEN